MESSRLPKLPVAHDQLVNYIAQRPNTPLRELLEPHHEFEARLRELYAQDRDNSVLNDPHINVLPLFTKDTPAIQTRARDLGSETQDQKDKYIMPLSDDKRRPNGSPAVVGSLKEFQYNFSIFSESSMSDMNWNNVVAAGSSVVNALLPVPPQYKKSKRALRKYYHEIFCPASDVDLFLYGLSEEQAIQKIKDIETHVRDALLTEVTVVRTKNAITICSQYPTRHIQIVLRLYKSISEILTGFDIDCSCAAYDGQQVYVTPRALASYMSQINTIDLSRRSPSYENRLSKYSHRNFEVYWPELDRSRVDPSIFERSFQRTLGLARLLVLEQLPTTTARESYQDQRRSDRGRPPHKGRRSSHRLHDNLKDIHEDEVADWADDEEVSNYHTFTLPYGKNFRPKRIERLCYTRDLLLNAQWNQPKDREVYLHRHPAFFGRVQDILGDCCGTCPQPQTPEEIEIAEKESKIYVSGSLRFRTDDPGRQEIGSFHPLTRDDWTEMAYVSDTALLCQAIVDGDLECVKGWLSKEGADPNQRDYTGRTPLHLAVVSSTPEIVKCLVDHGARLVSRIADGRTALHLAAARGNVGMVRILLEKSNANEEEEADKQDRLRNARQKAIADSKGLANSGSDPSGDVGDDDDMEMVDSPSEDGVQSVVSGSYVKVDKPDESATAEAIPLDDDQTSPDFYNIDVVAWDSHCSALHLAILGGHCEVVKLLCQEFGADPLLPVKTDTDRNFATLTLVLALQLPVEKAIRMIETLLSLGATSSQADAHGATAFHRFISHGNEDLIGTLFENDKLGLKRVINHVYMDGVGWRPKALTPLMSAISHGNPNLVLKLLEADAKPEVDFNSWLQGVKFAYESYLGDFERNQRQFQTTLEQPLLVAIRSPKPVIALDLLEKGIAVDTLTTETHRDMQSHYHRSPGESALDVVRRLLSEYRDFNVDAYPNRTLGGQVVPNTHYFYRYMQKIHKPRGAMEFLSQFPKGTYRHWLISTDIDTQMSLYQDYLADRNTQNERRASRKGRAEKMAAINDMISQLESVERALLERGAKTYKMLHQTSKVEAEAAANNTSQSKEDSKKTKHVYDFQLAFKSDRELSSAQKKGYVRLFEAAWDGDLEQIRRLTTAPWGHNAKQPPLEIAIKDSKGNNPFSLAVIRGHFDVARAILEIVQSQYSPVEEERNRYQMRQADTDEGSDVDVDSNDGQPDICKEVINDQYTIDNIGQATMEVRSKVLPFTVLRWPAPSFAPRHDKPVTQSYPQDLLRSAIEENDSQRFTFLLDMHALYADNKEEGADQSFGKFYVIPQELFHYALQRQRTGMLAEMIERFGAGISFEHLVKKSGRELKVKPLYYQGLTVYGKKRADWAKKAGQRVDESSTGSKISPVLLAALHGSVEAVKWFLSDAPMKCYHKFGQSQIAKEDPRLAHLHESPGGFDQAISRWLGNQNNLIIHCAVLHGNNDSTLIKYLAKTCPSYLEAKSDLGYTPLYLACYLKKVDCVKALIDAGADQSTRDKNFNNLIHACLSRGPTLEDVRKILDLFDPQARARMCREQNRLRWGGNTPIQLWLLGGVASRRVKTRLGSRTVPISASDYENNLKVLELLLGYAKNEDLEVFNKSGDTALHVAVLQSLPLHAKLLIERHPDLLYRENTVGRTPAEVAHDVFVSEKVQPLDKIQLEDFELINKEPETFVPDVETTDLYKGSVWDVVQEYIPKIKGKRRLVTLNEANDVARALADSKYRKKYHAEKHGRGDDDENQDGEKRDNDDGEDVVTVTLKEGRFFGY